MSMHWWEIPPKKWGHQISGARAPEVWCPSKLTNRFFVLISRMGFRTMNFSCLPSVYMCFMQNLVILEHCQHKMSMHWWENPPKKMGAPEFWCPSKLTNRFFVLISRMGFRTMNFSCFPSVFMCSTQNLVLSEHGQHEWACNDQKTLKK